MPRAFAPERIYLGFGGTDDAYTLFVNGREVATRGDIENEGGETFYGKASATDVTDSVRRGEENLIALRLVDRGGMGGLHKAPVLLTGDEAEAFGPMEVVRRRAAGHPDWVLPPYLRDGGIAWTITGRERGRSEALFGIEGSIQPQNEAPSLSFWVYDEDLGELFAPSPDTARLRLQKGYLPWPVLSWRAGPSLLVETSLLTLGGAPAPDEQTESLASIYLQNDGGENRRLRVYAAIRPYAVNGEFHPVKTLSFVGCGKCARANGKLFWYAEKEGSAAGALSLREEDVSALARRGEIPAAGEASDEMGLLSGAAAYDLELPAGKSTELRFFLPMGESVPGFVPPSVEETAAYWEKRLNEVSMDLPEPALFDGWRASLAYVLISADGKQLHPGPLAYDSFWYRDSAYMVAALNRAGRSDVSRGVIEAMNEYQKENGEFPSIVSADGKPTGPPEWDSQGQAIFAIADTARFAGEPSIVKEYWPCIARGAEFLIEKRRERLTDEFREGPPEKRACYGLLPPSVSAEDLGPGEWHHYWDDFWAVLGLREASEAAQAAARGSFEPVDSSLVWGPQPDGWTGLDQFERAVRFLQEADDLLRATLASARLLGESNGIDWIPNGPEDLEGTSMARGTSPGIWPGQALDPADPLVRRSFEVYWEKWIEPNGGGYFHQGRIWPYGMELAQCYVMLGEREKAETMLRWHVEHQTLKGAFAWAEQIETDRKLFEGGDMPHAWVAADYVNLLRSMLLYEVEPRTIVVGAGVPEEWFDSGFSIAGAPTRFGGRAGVSVERKEDRIEVALEHSGGAARQPVWRLDFPNSLRPRSIRIGDQPEIPASFPIEVAGFVRLSIALER